MSRAVRLMVAGAVVLLVAQYPLDGGLALWMANGAWTIAAAAAALGCRFAVRSIEDDRRRSAWHVLMYASIAWLTGQILWDGAFIVDVAPGVPSPADYCWLAFAALAGTGVARLGAAGRELRFQLLESLAIAIGVSGVTVALLWDDIASTTVGSLGTVTAVAYAVLYLSAASMLVQVMPRRLRLRAHRDVLLLFGGFAAQAAAFTWWAPLLLDQSYDPGRSAVDLLWVVGLGLIALAGLQAPRSEPIPAQTRRETLRAGMVPSVVLFAVLGTLMVLAVTDQALGARVTLIGAASAMALLLSIRARLFGEQVLAAEEDLARYVELAPVMLARSRHGRFLSVNPAFTRTLGFSEEELLSTPVLDLIHPDDVERTSELIRQLVEENRPIAVENRYRHKDGGYRWLSWTAIPVAEHDVNFSAARDITELKEAQAELERSNADLERFAYAASHDLAEPLRTISSFSQLIVRDIGDELDERPRRHLRHVTEAADRMRALIDAMLGYSRVGRQRVEIAPVDVAELVQGTTEALAVQIGESHASVVCDEVPVVRGDARQLGQLMQNLISNAVKFHGEEPPVVRVGGARENGGWHLTVTDNGIGIEERHRARVFEMFERLHSRADYGGTGIGLALCSKIVERHGGRLWVEPAEGGGSAFHFTIEDPKEQHVA